MSTLIDPTTDSAAFSPRFDVEGVLVVDPLISSDDINTLSLRTTEIAAGTVAYPREHLELEPGVTDLELATLRKINHCHFHDEVFAAHAAHPAVLDVIESLIGPDIKLFGSQLFMKPPGGVEKPWHQDSAYFPLDPQIVVTCWTALDNVTLENGCMHVIVGSHRDGIIDHSQEWMIGARRDMKVPDAMIDENRTRAITLSAGGCSF
ncbi:MAG: phytanoyl-CoA dioxygenase family protein, partial [Planctomycetota bacterium]|nr:phytanoyl-CoA dioxygenase family protein [Planctomycetota bacterium]